MARCGCYSEGYNDGLKYGKDDMKNEIRKYISELKLARDVVATGAHPENNDEFWAAVADGQKTVLDNVISRLEEMVKGEEDG